MNKMTMTTESIKEWTTTEPDAPPIEPPKYQLYFDNTSPRHWYLSVRGGEKHPIKAHEISAMSKFRSYLIGYGHNISDVPANLVQYGLLVDGLMGNAIQNEEPPPFLQSNVGHIENLELYFSRHISMMVRSRGKEFLDGKVGENVRVRLDVGRIYFKWQNMKMFLMRALNAREGDIEALNMFIVAKGGYQGEKGERAWFRWTYWMPMNLFEQQVIEKWFEPDKGD